MDWRFMAQPSFPPLVMAICLRGTAQDRPQFFDAMKTAALARLRVFHDSDEFQRIVTAPLRFVGWRAPVNAHDVAGAGVNG